MPTETSPSGVGAAPRVLDLADIQGVILRGYSHHLYIRFFILRIREVAGARQLCALLANDGTAAMTATTAQSWSVPPAYCLNVAVTSSGLGKLVGANYPLLRPPHTSGALFNLFDAGAADSGNAATVGDTGDSDPSTWWRNGNWKLPAEPSNDDLDLLVALYTPDAVSRESFAETFLGMIPRASDGTPAVVPAFVQDSDPLLDETGKPTEGIHFDYIDGISQPRVKDTPWYRPNDPTDERPPVESWHFVIEPTPPGNKYRAHPVLNDGCFGAFRLLFQDVGGFRCFIAQTGDPALVAAKMCGRWQDGTPLMLSPDKPDPSIQGKALSNFGYTTDQTGAVCPFAAHTRRANPRDDTDVQGNVDPVTGQASYAAQHRVMRRARPYGPPYEKDPDAQRGLVGLFLGANLANQFQFLMNQWIGVPGFRNGDNSPNASGVDPLFGPLGLTAPGEEDFIYLQSPPPPAPPEWETVPKLSRFIRTDGALYVFLPSFTALRLFAEGKVA